MDRLDLQSDNISAVMDSSWSFTELLDFLPDAMFALDCEGRVRIWNRALEEMTGVSREKLLGEGDYAHAVPFHGHRRPALADLVLNENSDFLSTYDKLERRGETLLGETFVPHLKGGRGAYLRVKAAPLFDRDGRRVGVIETLRDVTRYHESEQALARERAFLQAVIDGIDDPILVVGRDRRVNLVNRVARDYLPDQGRNCTSLSCYDFKKQAGRECWQGGSHQCPIDEVTYNGRPMMLSQELTTASGEKRLLEIKASPLRDTEGRITGMIQAGRDVTERLLMENRLRQNEERLAHLAHFDPLTDLANRLLFLERFEHAATQARRLARRGAVMLLDLDHFKKINDSLGYEIGDSVLKTVARRLDILLPGPNALARLGADEFGIILENVKSDAEVGALARKVLAVVGEPINHDSHQFFLSASIGICFFPELNQSTQEVMQRAEVAMFRAKKQGRNGYQFYHQSMESRSRDFVDLHSRLKRALTNNELLLYYQPKVSLHDGRLQGVEALVRWQCPDEGLISPGRFIPLAEDTGLIEPIGAWVLESAVRQMARWKRSGHPPLVMSVNISGRQFRKRSLVSDVKALLDNFGISPTQLEFEITESVLMDDIDSTSAILRDLSALGIHLAIDDFGTGYSSLSYLSRFPISTLKIDRSFVMDLPENLKNVAVVGTIIDLARNMGLEVVAEGIETRAQLRLLRERGCQIGQGYLFGRPMPPVDLTGIGEEEQSQEDSAPFCFFFPDKQNQPAPNS